MKRIIVVAAMSLAMLGAVELVGSPTGVTAQDDAQATISALQTETSGLQTQVASASGTEPAATADEAEPTVTADETAPPTVAPTAPPDLPEGVPSGSEEASIAGHEDGDKIRVALNGETKTVHLIGSDAPEVAGDDDLGECFATESGDRLKEMLPEGRIVYLERDATDEDKDDRLWRYVWFVGEDQGRTRLANRVMIREGYSVFKAEADNTRYDDPFEREQATAKERGAGLWDACGGGHVEITPESAASGLTEKERDYLDAVIPQTDALANSMNELSELTADPRYRDEDWILRLAGVVVVWRLTYDEAQQITPPERFAELHAEYLTMLGVLNSAGDDLLSGIDNGDVGRINSAAEKLCNVNQRVDDLQTLLEEAASP